MREQCTTPDTVIYGTQDLVSFSPNISSFDREIGEQLRKLRRNNKLTLQKLGKILNISGQQIQKYERGVNSISASKLAELSKYFGVSVSVFYSGSGVLQELGERAQSKYIVDPLPCSSCELISEEKKLQEFIELFSKCTLDEQQKLVETMRIWAKER